MFLKQINIIKRLNTNCLINISNTKTIIVVERAFSSLSSVTSATKYIKYSKVLNRTFSRFSANNIMTGTDLFRISDYDCVGFDLDNTLLRYKVSAMVKLEFEVLAKYMVEHKGYSEKHLLRPFNDQIDFLQKGLIVDFHRGNIVKSNADGYIQKVAHGTKILCDAEIVSVYGSERKWSELDAFTKDVLVAWNGPAADKLRTLLDFFDMPASLVFARCVDSLDDISGSSENVTYNIWPDILDGLLNMYTREHFQNDKSEYFQALKERPTDYIHVASSKVLDFLKELKSKKTTFLLTGSHIDFATLTATHALGENWKDLFDAVVCFAKKPGFFNMSRPFVQLDGYEELLPLEYTDLKLNGTYSQGNWQDLIKLLAIKRQFTGEMKVLYVGDNLIQDVYAPATFAKCDTIAIVEEMLAEDSNEKHPDSILLKSLLWGSYFGTYNDPSLWSDIIRKHSKICVASVDVIAQNRLDHSYKCFTNEKSCDNGFYPNQPATFRQNY